jgi:hypothetical protein
MPIATPPNWVKDMDLWKKAIAAVEKNKGKGQGQFDGGEYGAVTAEYKKLGGQIGGKKDDDKSESVATVDQIRAVLDELMPK